MASKITSQPGAAESPSPQDQPGQSHRILLADDDVFMRRMNEGVLLRSGYQVVAVEDGEEAWDALHSTELDLLITDNDMPKLTGVELLKRLHASQIAVPVILATGVPPTEELERHPWLQVAATLLKPFTVEELLSTVAEVLHAIDGPNLQTMPPPQRQNQPSDDDL